MSPMQSNEAFNIQLRAPSDLRHIGMARVFLEEDGAKD